LPHFEISIKLRIFYTHTDLLEEKNNSDPICEFFSFFGAQKTSRRTGRHENKEKRFCYFGFSIYLPIKI
jgi:hypothetical protein